MKIRTCAALLLAVLMLSLLTGCSLWAVDEGLDAVEDAVENRVDAVEDAAENAILRALIPNATQMPPAADIPTGREPVESTPVAVTKEEAEAIALQYAGFTVDQVSYLWTEYEIDDGIPQYDVQFREDYWEYEFEIHAETGKILSYYKDA